MGCTESKANLQALERYAAQLKNPKVAAVMDALAVDKRGVGLRFYRAFASMDTDGSNSIDLDELHCYFGLPRTTFSDQVFSGLGKQASARAVTFDGTKLAICYVSPLDLTKQHVADFVINIWNFCTMASSDLFKHIFQIYDDDHSGTLDAAECDSLFRLLYHTNELSPDIKEILSDVDSNGDGLLSLDEFLVLCSRNRALMSPIIMLQAKARAKCLGTSFWAKESKKRSTLLADQQDIFSLVYHSLLPKEAASPVTTKEPFDPVVDKSAAQPPAVLQPKASERLAAKQRQRELKELETWIEEQRQHQPAVNDYFITFSDKFRTESQLQQLLEVSRPSAGDVKLITELRYSSAVCAKKFDAAKANVIEIWEIEQQSMIERRHESVKAMVRGVSTKTLLKQTGKQSAASAIGNYLQKKLDEAEQDVRRQVQERWATLGRAANHVASQDLAATASEASDRQPMGSLFAKDENDRTSGGHVRTKIVPINSETWTEYYDEASGRYYYVSSLGYSTWDRPESYVAQRCEFVDMPYTQ